MAKYSVRVTRDTPEMSIANRQVMSLVSLSSYVLTRSPPTAFRLVRENNRAAKAARSGPHECLEYDMKSFGLTLTILTITGALVALDLSGANRAGAAPTAASASNTAKHELVAQQLIDVQPMESKSDEPADEVEPELFNAFHVTAVPITTAPATRPAIALRYD